MKRKIALILALTMLASALCGCAKKESKKINTDNTESAVVEDNGNGISTDTTENTADGNIIAGNNSDESSGTNTNTTTTTTNHYYEETANSVSKPENSTQNDSSNSSTVSNSSHNQSSVNTSTSNSASASASTSTSDSAPAVSDPKPDPKPDPEPVQNSEPEKLYEDAFPVSYLFEETNSYREENGLAPLRLDSTLCSFAETRAYEAGVQRSHTRPDGRDISSLFTDAGIEYTHIGENLAYCSIYSVLCPITQWEYSSGHRANLLGNYTSVGMATVKVGDTYYTSAIYSK